MLSPDKLVIKGFLAIYTGSSQLVKPFFKVGVYAINVSIIIPARKINMVLFMLVFLGKAFFTTESCVCFESSFFLLLTIINFSAYWLYNILLFNSLIYSGFTEYPILCAFNASSKASLNFPNALLIKERL